MYFSQVVVYNYSIKTSTFSNNMSLPTFTSIQTVRNPDWKPILKPIYGVDNHASNMDDYYQKVEIEAEILTLNLNARSMRIRFPWMGKIETRDISMPDSMSVTLCY